MRRQLGFLGGTGPLGRGLGARFARAGYSVLLGSRDEARAKAVASELADTCPDGLIRGARNDDVARTADVVFVAVPYAAQHATVAPLADAIGEKVVVNCVNSLGFDKEGPHPVAVEAGSAAVECAEALPDAHVVGAFQNISAVVLNDREKQVDADVLIVGDDQSACAVVADLARELDGVRPILAGPLRLARPIEELTAVLISINKRYRAHSSLRLTGVDESTLTA